MKGLIFVIWFIVAMVTLSVCLDMLSAADTTENIAGLVLLAILIIISLKTKCFIKILKIWEK